jgi:hypothetical protein
VLLLIKSPHKYQGQLRDSNISLFTASRPNTTPVGLGYQMIWHYQWSKMALRSNIHRQIKKWKYFEVFNSTEVVVIACICIGFQV